MKLQALLPTLLAVAAVTGSAPQLCAQTPGTTYGAYLLEEVSAAHPGVLGLEMRQPGKDGAATRTQTWGKRGRPSLNLPMQDAGGTAIGELIVSFPRQTVLSAAQQAALAEAIRNDLRHYTLDATNPGDPFPFAAKLPTRTYGQHLVDDTLTAHHEVLALAFHAKPSDDAPSAILASSFGRLGKLDDAGDLSIVAAGQPQANVTQGGRRLNIGLPLHDYLGHTLGLLTVAYAYADGDDKPALIARATLLRNEVGRRLLERESLLEPYPFDPHLPAAPYAQRLVEEVMLAHPRVVGVALHATLPGRTENAIVASTFGRVGKLSDDSDLQMIRSGKHNMKVQPGGERYSGELTLRDSARRTLGALLIIFPYKSGDDTAAMLVEAKQIRQELAAKIQNNVELTTP